MFDAQPLNVHVLPLDDLKFGRRRPRLEKRVVISVDDDSGPNGHITVASSGRPALVWVGVRPELGLQPGDAVSALWFEGFVQGWGPVAQVVCADSSCEHTLIRLTPGGAERLVPHQTPRHFSIARDV